MFGVIGAPAQMTKSAGGIWPRLFGRGRLIAAGGLWACLLGRTRRRAERLEFRELVLEACELERDE